VHGVFISYRREDAAGFAGRLADSLERHLPHEPVFRDVDALAPGQDFVAAIEARLRQCRVCLAVIGREWLNSRDADGRRRLDQSDDFVRLELAAALARPEVLLVPVLVEGAPMPPGDALPSEIRSLARRQAVSLRDDMWDADVARLAQSLQPALASTPPPLPASSFPRAARWTGAAVAALGLLALLVYALGGQDAAERSTSATEAPPANVPVEERAGGSPAVDLVTPANPTVGNPGGARELSIPRVSQVGTSGLVYTLMSARLEPGAPSDTLHLRVALENESAGGVNFWDDTFRLIVGGDTIAPSSNLNVGVAGRSTSEGVVRFHVPRGVTAGRLRISVRGSSGDIPLDFSGRAAAGAIAADTPRSARAIVTSISRESRLLVTAPILSASLTEVATRRFANVLRVDLHLRFVNPGPGPILSGHLTLRLVVGDEVLAPTAFPNEVIDGGSTRRLLVEFEVPPPTTQAVLRATAGDAKVEVPLTLR
jgi:hypothetical protein